jgi:hypothetical protein
MPSSNFFYLICWIFSSLAAIFSARLKSCYLFVSCSFKSILYCLSRFSNCFFYFMILWSASRLSLAPRPPILLFVIGLYGDELALCAAATPPLFSAVK